MLLVATLQDQPYSIPIGKTVLYNSFVNAVHNDMIVVIQDIEWKFYFLFSLQETSFASNQPVTRSLSSVTSNNKSKLPMAVVNTVNNQNRINNAKKTSNNSNDLEQISPWLVSTEAITTKKEKEKSKIPQLKTVITTEL